MKAASLAEYYLDAVDSSLYYLTGNAPGVWYGEGAAALGFEGELHADEFRAAFEGRTPDGSRSLVQQQKGKARQPAWDITFSAPKPVSVLWSQLDACGRHRIEELVMRATKRAVDYLEAEAVNTRRGSQGRRIERARGVWGLCPHGTSRAQDPQLHIHALCFNLCVRKDGSKGTIRSRDLYIHKMAAGAIFRLELAQLLAQELGLRIVRDGFSFKLIDVPDSLCQQQSKRRKVIETIANESGWSSPQTLAELAIATRGPKGNVSLADCFEHWRKEAEEFGFTREHAEQLLSQGKARLADRQSDRFTSGEKAVLLKQPIAKAIEALSAFKAYFPARDLVFETANRAIAKGVSATELLDEVKNTLGRFENRIKVEQDHYAYYSTKESIAAEKELIERAEKGKEARTHLVNEDTVAAAKAKVERSLSKSLGTPVKFTDDQDKTLRHITLEPGNLKLAQGYAGSGKTQMLAGAHIAWSQTGFKVRGVTLTGKAALGLQTATGIPTVTVESLFKQLRPNLTRKDKAKLFIKKSTDILKANYWEAKRAGAWMRNPFKQALRETLRKAARKLSGASSTRSPACKLTKNTVLVIDEIGMLPTRTFLALKQECDKVGAKMVGVGDRRQIPPIQAGGPFWSLANRIGHASLTTVIRQRLEWMREAVELIINDQPQRALELYARHGALHLEKHTRAAIEKLVADYSKLSAQEIARSLALTSTRDEAHRINEAMQTKRKAKRELGRGSLRLPNGERVHKQDRVMLTLNDYRLGVRNGLLGTVVALHRTRGIMGPGSITIQLDHASSHGFFRPKPTTITIDLKKFPEVELGYAATTHKAQGVTVEKSFILMGDSMLSREMAFTQLSRASHESTLYASKPSGDSPLAQLAQQISKVTAKDLAHDHTIKSQQEQNHARSLSL